MTFLPTIQARPGLGSLIGQSLGAGLGQGIAHGAEFGMKLGLQKQESNEMKKFADQISKENPDNPRYQMLSKIYGMNLPAETKNFLIKSMVGSDPWDMSRKFYLNRKDLVDGYDREIKNYSSLLKSGSFDQKQAEMFQSKIQDLMKEREQHLAMYDAQFKSQLGFSPAENFAEKVTKSSEGTSQTKVPEFKQPEIKEETSSKKRVAFDRKNPEHVARRNEVLKKTGGDEGKAEQVLLKEFTLD